MQNAFDFYLPTRLCFGSGARRRLPEQLTRLGVRNLLLCTDKMLRSAGVVEKITSILDGCADVRYTACLDSAAAARLTRQRASPC